MGSRPKIGFWTGASAALALIAGACAHVPEVVQAEASAPAPALAPAPPAPAARKPAMPPAIELPEPDDAPAPREMAVHHAMTMLGQRYRRGAASPDRGFDASGLVHWSYGKAGVTVPRTLEEQRKFSGRVFLSNLELGDLVYFDLDGKKNAHVGIYIGDARFVHAASSGRQVRMDRLDTPYWRERVSEARRLDARAELN